MKKITLYTKDYCPYCAWAKQLLDEIEAEYEEIDITRTPQMIRELVKKSGLMTVPQIFADGKCLGGWDDLSRLQEEGRLAEELGL